MKTLTSILITLVVLGLPSCKKSDTTSSHSMRATINGTAFTASSVVSDYQGGTLQIIGSTQTEEIELILSYKGSGTYDISSGWPSEHLASYTKSGFSYTAKDGIVILSGTSPNVTGTFDLTLTGGLKITGGSFTAQGF